jgi:glycosyltransferase involved in cell wall biosynthesis
MKIFYMGLESYQARYTFQLTDWTKRAYNKRGVEYVIVPGETIDDSEAIVTGQVLDAHGRSYFSMSQMMNLVKMLKAGEITSKDIIFFEDMFQPGMESLPYILQQTPEKYRPAIYLRCLAQAIDPDDFVHVWGMSKWMSLYEQMCNEIPNVRILATNEEMVAHMRIANWSAPIYNISGLSFGKEEVQERVPDRKQFVERSQRVVFGARWDQEKQPQFFMDLATEYKKKHPDVEFAICQGGPLRSNNKFYVDEAKHLAKEGILTIHENLEKNEYYKILADSRVLFNCALQDWVSNTVSEADSLGCNVLYPAYRSFPETFANDETRLYVPWSQKDAMDKLEILLSKPSPSIGRLSDWTNGTIDRMIDIMTGKGEQWRRDGQHYRTPVSESKY